MNSIADIRKEYTMETLLETDVHQDPLIQFDKWWQQALNSDIDEVNAMTLATADNNGKPSARIVLLKGFDKNGFVFFTNYESHKAADMLSNPQVSLVLFWKELQRQVRIEGTAVKIDAAASDVYFQSRPKGSKIGAWASPQSKEIISRSLLEEKVKEYELRFSTTEISRPPHWGGYTVHPVCIEFWQGRASRLHDRIVYERGEADCWRLKRLAP